MLVLLGACKSARHQHKQLGVTQRCLGQRCTGELPNQLQSKATQH